MQFRHTIHQLTNSAAADDHHRLQLVHKTVDHYSGYYQAKSAAAKHDALAFFAPPWTTALERSLLWIGGWRPTTASHLLYTESSILFESQVADILRGVHTGNLGDLSPAQFQRVSELQCATVGHENDISDELSDWQDNACDVVGMCGDIESKMERLAAILDKADQLRLKTIKSLVELLTPQQAAELLVAAAELHFGIRAWGIQHDGNRRRRNI
ncbi:protein DOG1-like 3 [Andrographis paniculata]|uniref:protein DOG1-like 3 n=1 Tax=Andrographis paniculata TaxID=175694 RepID=UPI0021E8CE9B|nr:protein DOG1-like 3 [Andrographis paniculata]